MVFNQAKQLKILSLQYYSYPDAVGGAWRVSYELNRRFVERGDRVTLITCKPSDALADAEKLEGVRIFRIPKASAKSVFALRAGIAERLEGLLKEGPIDVIHVHNPLVGFLALTCPATWKIPMAYHFHSSWFDEEIINRQLTKQHAPGWMDWLKAAPVLLAVRFMEWLCLSHSRLFLVLSEYSKRRLRRYFPFHDRPARVIASGVDAEEFTPPPSQGHKQGLRRKLNLPEDRPIFLTVRRLHHRMGLENWLRALALASEQEPDKSFLALIAGEGPVRETLERRIVEWRLEDKVRLMGLLSREDLPLYYQAADVFILPTERIEGFGLVTAEAMASGLPVLGTPVGATRELLGAVDERLLFRDASAEAMRDGLLQFLNDPQPVLDLGPLCRRRAVAEFSWDAAAEKIQSYFYELAKRT